MVKVVGHCTDISFKVKEIAALTFNFILDFEVLIGIYEDFKDGSNDLFESTVHTCSRSASLSTLESAIRQKDGSKMELMANSKISYAAVNFGIYNFYTYYNLILVSAVDWQLRTTALAQLTLDSLDALSLGAYSQQGNCIRETFTSHPSL
ncbi:hypothetical protein V6N11_013007 [Hibiscus sabdariffa]|uniref:Uncharacterized protein n=1 Tax=Hibiscus sabdariffa TaxID=183260 RepID=A0ABR2NCR4_9ROSI